VKTKNNVHPQVDLTVDEAVSAWWDCELDSEQHGVLVDDVLLSDESQHRVLGYSLIGAALRGEHLETRDLASAVRMRLEAEPVPAHADNVVPLRPVASVRRSWGWSGAIAASVVAGLVGVGVWMTQPANQTVEQPTAIQSASLEPSPAENPLAGTLSASAPSAELAQGLRAVSDNAADAFNRMPAWAQVSPRRSRIDPYLMTHYEATAPQFGDLMPSARMTSFEPE